MKKIYLSILFCCFLFATSIAQNVTRECVLIECFTGINCGYCPGNAAAVSQMLAEELNIAPISYHTSAYSPATYYTTETNARASYYGVTSYPTSKFDGILTQVGGAAFPGNTYSSMITYYNQRVGITSPFTINLSYSQVSGDNYQVVCTVEQVGENTSSNLKIMIALTQSNIAQNWQGMTTLNNVCRDMIPTQTGTAYAGGTQTVTENFTLSWPKEDCNLVAWVQDYSTKEVHQSVRLTMNTPDFDYDVKMYELDNITVKNCSGKMSPIVIVKNEGAVDITSFDVVIKIDDVEINRQNWSGEPISFTKKATVFLDEITFTAPSNTAQIEILVENPNGQNDMNEANNYIVKEITSAGVSDEYFTLLMQTDANPLETTVEVINMDINQVVSRLTFNQASTSVNKKLYFPIPGCYRFVIYDEAGNGITTYFTLRSSSTPPQTLYNGASSVNPFKHQVSVELTTSTGATDQVFPPINIIASGNTRTGANLTWGLIDGIAITPESFNIYKNGTLLANTSEFSFSDPDAGDDACYTIKSVANNVESESSAEVCVVILYPPMNVIAELVGTNVNISWSVPNSGEMPESYNVYRDDILVTNLTTTNYIDQLDDFGTYCYSISSIIGAVESEKTTPVCVDYISISELSASQVSVFPNPSNGQFNISTSIKGDYQVVVYDLSSRKVYENRSFNDGQINLNNLVKGMYILTIISEKETYSQKIIIR